MFVEQFFSIKTLLFCCRLLIDCKQKEGTVIEILTTTDDYWKYIEKTTITIAMCTNDWRSLQYMKPGLKPNHAVGEHWPRSFTWISIKWTMEDPVKITHRKKNIFMTLTSGQWLLKCGCNGVHLNFSKEDSTVGFNVSTNTICDRDYIE